MWEELGAKVGLPLAQLDEVSAEDRHLLVKTEPPLVHGLEQRQCQSDDPAVVVEA